MHKNFISEFRLSVIVPSLTGVIPASVKEIAGLVELIVVKGVSPVAAARNEGLSRATGDYVAWVDADDEVTLEWLPQISTALAGRPDIVTFNARVEWHDGSGRAPYCIDGRTAGQLWCKVFRRSLFKNLRFEGAIHEDWRIQCQMPKNLRRVHIDKELYVYRRSAMSLSQHPYARAELSALWGLLKICNSFEMFKGICERTWDFAKTPLRHLKNSVFMPSKNGLLARSLSCWVVDARTLASRPTGIGMYAKRQLLHLMKVHTSNRWVLVVDVQESAALQELIQRGAEVRVYGRHVFNSVGVLGYLRFVRQVVKEVKPEVFWQPNNLQPFRLKQAKRVIVSMHDVFGLSDWSARYFLWHLYYRFSFRRTLRNATEIWFNSHETECLVSAAAPRLITRLRCQVVYPITEVPNRAVIEPYLHSRPYFLYVGNIESRKGADLLLTAYVRYRKLRLQDSSVGEPYDLIFAGIEKNVQIPRTAGISVLGYVSDATKFSLMISSCALIVPSRAEGYGMQVAEAAALGVRCLASDLSVFREIKSSMRDVFPIGDVDALVSKMALL